MAVMLDSGGNETYPRRRATAAPVITGTAQPSVAMPRGGTAVPRGGTAPGGVLRPGRSAPGSYAPVLGRPAAPTTEPGETPAPGPEVPPAPTPAPGPNYQTLGSFANRLRGYDMSKFQRPYDQWSEKYKVGAVQSWFDPSQGVNQGFLDALRGLNLADYSGSGDSLTAMNGRNGARYGAGGASDVIQNYAGGQGGANAMWAPWVDAALERQAAQAAQPAAGTPTMPGQMWPEGYSQSPGITVNSGIDPAALQAILMALTANQQQPVAASAYQAPVFAAPQVQAPPMPLSMGQTGPASIQTQSVGGPIPLGEDPFTAFLRQLGGAQ